MNPRGEHKPMHKAMARAQVLKSFTLKSHQKQLMLMGRREEEQRGDAPRTPRSRSTRFPSLRGEMDWWKCRSRSPLTFPQRYARIMGGIERGQAFLRSTMEEREGENVLKWLGNIGEEGPLNRSPKNCPLGCFSAPGRYYRA